MKKVLGLILELNPYHNGHDYFIKEAIKKVKPDIVIVVTSGNFTMRGEVSVLDKFSKTRLLLENNIDLVLELPFISAIHSADLFSLNALSILNKFKITDLAFGVELNNLDKLKTMQKLIDSDSFNAQIKEYLEKGFSYSNSALKAISELTKDLEIIENFTLPNNTLAIQYLRSIEKLNKRINIHPIKRIENNYYDKEATSYIASATSLRNLINQDECITKYIPNFKTKFSLAKPKDIEDNLFKLIKYQFMSLSEKEILNILGMNEGIENRIKNFLATSTTYEQLVNNIQTKRYTHNKIKRLLLHLVMKTNKIYENKSTYYLRMLGANKNGLAYINKLPKSTKEKIITSFKNLENNKLVQTELKATKLYCLLTNKNSLNLEEFKIPIIGG